MKNRAWSYESPTKGFEAIKGYVSLYAGPWDCYVDGEKVDPQPGEFYGGWLTSDIEGKVKGGPGTWYVLFGFAFSCLIANLGHPPPLYAHAWGSLPCSVPNLGSQDRALKQTLAPTP